ncbi:hypothetical protein [Corynebacterium epidermidicanis]|uniref:Uncharacterized protein n=1 Tax=Corynebacterium epidermidicanis TaxID=1050174 RepID=A0A0G3GYR0_9CORY|nr:hypothetical protein [Corynebacterium epidermidicanis]AKK04002.1 hypothetical protein CEPID_10865 [Corynebacterium epidermidicanis]
MAEFFTALSVDSLTIVHPLVSILRWLQPFADVADATSELIGLVA